jgi:RNA polymerase sigma factor (sigma-70 family)
MKSEKDYRNLRNIWSRFVTGDQEAFAVLYNLHIDHLYHYGSKLCNDDEAVKDSLQELFLELFLKREKIKVNPENLKFYLLLALKRSLVKKILSNRKKNRDVDHSIDFEPEYSIEFQIMERERDAEITRKVSDALRQLPAKQKEAIYLRFNAGLEYPEIADILEITVESVRKQVHRALKTIREILGNESQPILFSIFFKKVKKAVHVLTVFCL